MRPRLPQRRRSVCPVLSGGATPAPITDWHHDKRRASHVRTGDSHCREDLFDRRCGLRGSTLSCVRHSDRSGSLGGLDATPLHPVTTRCSLVALDDKAIQGSDALDERARRLVRRASEVVDRADQAVASCSVEHAATTARPASSRFSDNLSKRTERVWEAQTVNTHQRGCVGALRQTRSPPAQTSSPHCRGVQCRRTSHLQAQIARRKSGASAIEAV